MSEAASQSTVAPAKTRRQAGVPAARRALRPPFDRLLTPQNIRWGMLALLLMAFTASIVTFGRYFEWDEAVYFSQSGGILGAEVEPANYSPSRELGTPWLIAIIRAVGIGSVPWVRVAWMLVTIAALVVAFRAIGAVVGAWAGFVAAAVFGTYWLATAYLDSFFGSMLGGLSMLTATAVYLHILDDERRTWWRPVLLGVALAGGFFFRSVETVLVVLVLLGHSLVWRRAFFWRRRMFAVLPAVAAFTVAFVLPWLIHSQRDYGSPLGHLAAWVERRNAPKQQDVFTIGWHNGMADWFRLLTGETYDVIDYPRWATLVVGVALLALVVAAAVWLLRRWLPGRPGPDSPHLGLLLGLAVVSFALFFFYVHQDKPRYGLYGAIFSAAAAGPFLVHGVERLRQRAGAGRRWWVGLVGVAAVLWLAANASLGVANDRAGARYAEANREVVTELRDIADGRPCLLLFRGNVVPQLSIGVQCKAEGIWTPPFFERRAQEALDAGWRLPIVVDRDGGFGFDLADEWEQVARVPLRDGQSAMSVYVPPGWEQWRPSRR